MKEQAFEQARASLELALADAVKHGVAPGISAAASCGSDTFTVARGVKRASSPDPVAPRTLFQLGSLSKILTAAAIVKLAYEGRLDLDEPVGRLLPMDFLQRAEGRLMTARQFMSHSSGLVSDEGAGRMDLRGPRLQDFLAAGRHLRAVDSPGRAFHYSSAGWVILGRLLEVVTGRIWESAIESHVISPFELEDVVVDAARLASYDNANGHLIDPATSSHLVVPFRPYPPCVAPSGGASASATSLLELANVHLRGGVARSGRRVLAHPAVGEMQRSIVSLTPRTGGAHAWGLGWALYRWSGIDFVGHGGLVFGQASLLLLCPSRACAVAVLVNSSAGEEASERLARGYMRSLVGVPVPDFGGYALD